MFTKSIKALFILASIIFSISVQAQWEPLHNGPHQGDVYVIEKSGSNIYAATHDNGLYYSDNNGDTWIRISDSLPQQYIADISLQNGVLYAVLHHEGVFRTYNNGITWQSINNGLTPFDGGCLAFKGTDIYLGTYDGLFLSTDTGSSWSMVTTFVNIKDVLIKGNDLFVCTGADGVFRSQNGGSFTTVNTGITNLLTNNMTIKGTDLFVSTRDGIYMSVNNGASWTGISAGFSIFNYMVIANDDSTLYLTADPGVWKSDNNGLTWTDISNGITEPFGKSLNINGDTLYYGSYAGIFRSYDHGLNWESVGINTNDLSFIRRKGQLAVAASTLNGGIFISRDGGNSWRNVIKQLPMDTYFTGIITDSAILIGSANHGSFQSLDSGVTWQSMNGIAGAFVYPRASFGPNIIGGTSGSVCYSNNNGFSWTPRNNGISASHTISAAEVCDSTFFIITGSGLYSSNDNGLNWNSISLNLPPSNISTGGSRILAHCTCGPGVSLHLSTDKGLTWTSAVGDFPGAASTTAIKDSILFAGTFGIGVFYSNDDGNHWIPINNGLRSLGIRKLVVFDNYLYASTFQGLYRMNLDSLTAGKTEINIQPFLEIYPNPTSGNITIKFEDKNEENSLRIFDVSGKLIYSEENLPREDIVIQLNLNPGLYFINYIDKDRSVSNKIIVTK